jgi:hypothetical protein
VALYLYLILPPERLPKTNAIGREASQNGFQPARVDLRRYTGFLPIKIGQKATGFEYYAGPLALAMSQAKRFGSYQITARFGGDMYELLAASMFLRAAAKLSSAAYFDGESGKLFPPPLVEHVLSEQIAQVKKYVS